MKSLASKQRVLFAFSCGLVLSVCLAGPLSWAQLAKPAAPAPSVEQQQDALGRTTPRGTVLGFFAVAYSHNYETAAQYLNTRSKGKDAALLAQELFYVLDRRLPAKLNSLSNEPQGSMSDPLDSRRELIGRVESANGPIDIYVERIDRGEKLIWLFSRDTLAAVPDLYDEVTAISVENVLPDFLLKRYFGFSLFGWLFYCVGLPLLYLLLSFANRLLGIAVVFALRRGRERTGTRCPKILPHGIRLLIIAVAIHWTYSNFSLSLLARQIGSTTATLLTVVAVVWLLILLNDHCESYLKRRLENRGKLGATAILRPTRRLVDVIAIVAGLMFALHSFGINPSAALAGLGVGGIAVALAAQKTLENVIGGVSIILDEAVRVGEVLKVGDVVGTVEEIGLRSTRVRTMDRTVVAIPNGQMATMTLENFSARDSFWLRHVVGLSCESASHRVSTVLDRIREFLERDSRVLPKSARVRFRRFAGSNLEIEVLAYISARDWNHFLEIQEDLLLQVRGAITSSGLEIAFPSRNVYLKQESQSEPAGEPSVELVARASKT